jgi:hypothetical protein
MSDWTEGAQGAWERELHGIALRVDDDDKAAWLPWGWRVSRMVDRFTATEMECGRAATCDLAMTEAEGAASAWR